MTAGAARRPPTSAPTGQTGRGSSGVVSLYAKGGIDHVEKGVDFGRQVQANYTTVLYHKPADEFDPAWDLRGVVQDLYALYGVGRTLANNDAWPNYVEGNAFKAARDASRAAPVEPPAPAAQ